MNRYYVTDADGDYLRSYSAKPGLSWAMDEEDAAREWAEDVHADLDYPEELECIVTNPDGERFSVTVYAEAVWQMSSGRPEPLPASASPADPNEVK